MPAATLLLTGGTVATLGPEPAVLSGAAIAVDGERIVDVGPERALREKHAAARAVDVSGRLVLPGFINAHTHIYSALARGIPPSGPPPADFPEILSRLWWRVDRALDEEMVRASAELAAVDALRRGTTTLVDHHSSPSFIDGSLDLLAETIAAAGVRGSFCFEVSDRDGAGAAGLAENLRFIARERSAMTGALLGLHASFTLTQRTLEACAGAAAGRGTGCHVHLAEHPVDDAESLRISGMRAAERLASAGVLGPRTVVVHGVTLDESQAALLAETGTALVTNPRSNAGNGVGATPVARLLAAGVPVGLGTDGYTYDILSEAAFLPLAQRLAARSPRAADGLLPRIVGEGSPEVAARATGARAGRIEAGYAADLALFEYDPPTPLDAGSLWGHVLFGLTQAPATDVMVNGRWVVRNGSMTTLDEQRVRARAREQARRLWSRLEG